MQEKNQALTEALSQWDKQHNSENEEVSSKEHEENLGEAVGYMSCKFYKDKDKNLDMSISGSLTPIMTFTMIKFLIENLVENSSFDSNMSVIDELVKEMVDPSELVEQLMKKIKEIK